MVNMSRTCDRLVSICDVGLCVVHSRATAPATLCWRLVMVAIVSLSGMGKFIHQTAIKATEESCVVCPHRRRLLRTRGHSHKSCHPSAAVLTRV